MFLDKEFFERNGFTVEVEVTPYCNFACGYCENSRDSIKWDRFDGKPGINIDFKSLLQFIRKIKADRLTVLLNGGEPTLHPGLVDFCRNAARTENLAVMLCTNMSAPVDMYKTLRQYGVKLLPTYHEERFTVDGFSEKLEGLDVINVLVPCTKANIADIDAITRCFPSPKLMLLENQNISPAEINALAAVDPGVLKQYRMLLNARKKTARLCNGRRKYLSVGGNGDVYRCMFLQDDSVLGNIKDAGLTVDAGKFGVVCENGYCFYEF